MKFAFRQLLKNPGFTAVAVLTLALGIGANTAIFSVIETLMLRSLPVKNPDELVQVSSRSGTARDDSFAYPLYEQLRDGGSSLSGLFAAGGVSRERFMFSDSANAETEFIRAQAALSLVLLIGAGLFVRTLKNLRGIDFGFNQENVTLFDLEFTKPFETAQRTLLFKELLTRLEALPPVHSASLSTYYLMNGGVWTEDVVSEGYVPRRDEDLSCHILAVGPHFFETLGTRLLRGRDFGPQDEKLVGSSNDNAPRVAVINQSLARRYFGETDPLGRHVQFGAEAGKKYQIVGVVKDLNPDFSPSVAASRENAAFLWS